MLEFIYYVFTVVFALVIGSCFPIAAMPGIWMCLFTTRTVVDVEQEDNDVDYETGYKKKHTCSRLEEHYIHTYKKRASGRVCLLSLAMASSWLVLLYIFSIACFSCFLLSLSLSFTGFRVSLLSDFSCFSPQTKLILMHCPCRGSTGTGTSIRRIFSC